MGRKIHITEEQFNRIVKQTVEEEILNGGSYLNAGPSGEGNTKDLGFDVGVNPLPNGKPTTSDDIAKKETPRNTYWDRGVIPVRGGIAEAEEKKNLNEVSNANKVKKHKVSGELANKMKGNYFNAGKRVVGTKRIEHLLNGYTDNYAANLLSDMEAGKISPEEYEMLGGDELKKQLDRRVKSDQTIEKSFKQAKSDLGDNNAFISPHTKTSGNGEAHTSKTQSMTYYE